MGKTAVIFTCSHADPEASNERFSWLGEFLYDLKPDYVVDLGDGADMRSLNSYDTRYPSQIVNQSYEKDIEWYNDAQERLRWKFKKNKRKKPTWYGLEGNHENRIKKAIAHDPRLEGSTHGISFSHLQTDYWFDEYTEYENSAPGTLTVDGVLYSHYIASGNYGSALSSKHHACALVEKTACSTTVGHSHKFHYYLKTDARPSAMQGLVAGCFKGAEETWAGQANHEWTKGVAVKREVENGTYDLQWVSMEALKRVYS